jgi:signal transduction histidine kinase
VLNNHVLPDPASGESKPGGLPIKRLQAVPGSLTGLVIALILLAFVATLSFLGWQQYSNSAAEGRATNQQIFVLTRAMRDLEEAQNAQRGFLLSGEAAYTDRYHFIDAKIHQLLPTMAPVNETSASLGPLFRQSAQETLANLSETIRLAQAGGQKFTSKRIDQEVLMMDHLRALADQIDQSLQARATNLGANTRSYARWAQLSATIGCTGVFAILLVSNIQIKRLLSTREVLNRRLATANEDLQQFIFSASHDLQEPLRTLRIFADSLESKIKAHRPFDRDLYHLRTAAEQMSALLTDLLTYTEVADESFTTRELADMRRISREVIQELRDLVAKNSALIEIHELAPMPMASNHARHLLKNLISNAIRYHEPNVSPVVTVSASREGKRWIVCVKDNGIGIQPEYHQHIFGIFKRLHTRAEYPGTGLGLAICKKLVERYGGRIWVESTSGAGSSFFFSIPDVSSGRRLSA